VDARFWRGKCFLQLQEYDRAIDDLIASDRIQSQGRNSATIGYCYSLKREHDKAEGWYQTALGNGYQSIGCLNNLGVCLLDKKNPDLQQAERYLRKAIQIDPSHVVPLWNLALLELRRSERDADHIPRKGMEVIERAMEIAGDHADLHFLAIRLYGFASKNDPSYIAKCLAHIEHARRLGRYQTSAELLNDPALSEVLKSPEFRLTTKVTFVAKRLPPIARLIDPYLDDDRQIR
jgi:tetratricopeptide (TPR) repeat protein